MKKEGSPVTANKIYEKNGITFYHIHSDKFKTVRLDVFFNQPLERSKASRNALIPYVLRRGCRRYPTQQSLSLRLEDLYGAGLDVALYKKGENQFIHMSSSFVSDRYTTEDTRLFDEAGSLMLEVLTEPALDKGLFLENYVEQERGNLIHRIRSRVNEKMHYALQRCMEEMCKGEPFSVYEDGNEEDVKALNREELTAGYRELLEHSPVYVYVSGDVRDEDLKQFVRKFDVLERKEIAPPAASSVKKEVREIRRIEEPMDVNQGKLCLGYRTQVEAHQPEYFPLAIYNSVLGGGVHSKLFQNVREKESLAYSAFSRLEKFKGLLIVCGGIEIAQREKAQRVILEQVKAICEGSISDNEMNASRKSFQTGLKSMQDSQGSIVDFYLSQNLSNAHESIEEFLEKLMAVEKQEVIRIAEKIDLDTVYFLTSLSGEGMKKE